MIYIRCPSCSTILGNRQYEYDKKIEEIEANPDLNEDEKKELKTKLVNSLGLENPCCKMRIITYLSIPNTIL